MLQGVLYDVFRDWCLPDLAAQSTRGPRSAAAALTGAPDIAPAWPSWTGPPCPQSL